jgi:hypothetical protein
VAARSSRQAGFASEVQPLASRGRASGVARGVFALALVASFLLTDTVASARIGERDTATVSSDSSGLSATLADQGSEQLYAQRRRRKKRRRRSSRRRRRKSPKRAAPQVARPDTMKRQAFPEEQEKAASPAPPAPGGAGGLRRGARVEFDGRLVQGQTAKSGAIYLFARKRSELRSMVAEREAYRREILRTVYPNDEYEAYIEQ